MGGANRKAKVPPKGVEPLFPDRKIRRPRPLDEGGLV